MDSMIRWPFDRLTRMSSIIHWFLFSSGFNGFNAFDFFISIGWGGGHSHATNSVNSPRSVFNRSGSIIWGGVDHCEQFMHGYICHLGLLLILHRVRSVVGEPGGPFISPSTGTIGGGWGGLYLLRRCCTLKQSINTLRRTRMMDMHSTTIVLFTMRVCCSVLTHQSWFQRPPLGLGGLTPLRSFCAPS